MTPRPRKASDEEVFAAAQRVMMRRGPAQLTLAEIAGEAGLTAGALVQRFGSRRGLLVAMMAAQPEEIRRRFAALGAAHASPLAALRAYAEGMARMGDPPGMFAHHLGWLQVDLSDPELRGHLREQARAAREGIRGLLEEAAAAGELVPGTDAGEVARAVEVTLGGSLLAWAFHQEGPAAAWLRHDLEALLRPLLAPGAGRAGEGRNPAASPG